MIFNKRLRAERGSTSIGAVITGAVASIGLVATGVVVSSSIIPVNIDTARNGVCVKAYYSTDESIEKTSCTYLDSQAKEDSSENPPEGNNPDEEIVIEDPNAPIMRTTWDTTSDECRSITLPAKGVTTNVKIDWGGVKTESDSNGLTSPTLESNPALKVKTEGYFTEWGINQSSMDCLVSVDTWGETATNKLRFSYSKKLRHVAQLPESVTNLSSAFANIQSEFTIGNLKTPNVTSMQEMFKDSTKFNSPVTLDTSNVEYMDGMFWGATSFNQPIDFETPKLLKVNSMFRDATSFNQKVELDTNIVTTMAGMFWGATSFNQPIDFNTPVLDTTENMFRNATEFNSTVKLNTSKVLTTKYMFGNASKFDQPLDFDMREASSVAYMFNNATSFNQNLKHWTMKKYTAYAGFADGATKWAKENQPSFKWT